MSFFYTFLRGRPDIIGFVIGVSEQFGRNWGATRGDCTLSYPQEWVPGGVENNGIQTELAVLVGN